MPRSGRLRVAGVCSSAARPAVLAAARQLDGEVVELRSGDALGALARGGQVEAACVETVCDLGASGTAVLRVLAALASTNVALIVVGGGVASPGADALLRAAALLVERDRRQQLDRIKAG